MFPFRQLGDWLIRRGGPGGAFTAGLNNMDKGKFSIAAEAFQDAERLYTEQFGASHPRVAEAIAYRAWCYAKSNREADAVELYRKAIELESKRPDRRGDRLQQLVQQLAWARSKMTNG